MKKAIYILVVIIGLVLISLALFPLVFKGKINEMMLKKVNGMVDAKVTYGRYKLSFLQSFPDFTATFTDLAIVGKGEFEGDTLASFKKFSAQINVPSLIREKGIVVESLYLDKGRLQLLISEAGNNNWNIEKTDSTITPDQADVILTDDQDEDTPFKMLLRNVVINDFDFIYKSIKSDYMFAVYDLNGHFSGTMEDMYTILSIEASTPSINFNMGEIHYLQNNKLDLSTKLQADLETWEFKFQTGSSLLNGIPLQVNGGFDMPGDSMLFDIHFDVPDIDMKQVLTMIPAYYQKYMTDIQATGNIKLNGAITGLYYEEIYPGIEILFDIHDGVVKYPQLPDVLKIHQLNANVTKPEGDMDLMTVGITQLEMQLAQNPLSMHALFSNLFTDPHLDVALDGVIDLESLSKVIPLGDSKIIGMITADATIKGNYSDLESNNFTAFVSKGSVDLKNFFLQNSALPQGVKISNAALVLNNQNVDIKGLQGEMGRSDFNLSGELNNVITYLFASDVLKGQFELKSRFVDLNEFMNDYESGEGVYIAADTTKAEKKPLVLPEKVSINFNAKVDRLLFDQMDITQFDGRIALHQQKLTLIGLDMNLIGGKMKLNGTVLADGREYPDVNFNLDILNFDLPMAYRQIGMVQKYMPFAAKSQGKFSTKLNIESQLGTGLKMILSAITAKGSFSTTDLKLVDASFFSSLKSVIKYDRLRNFGVDNFKTNFSIKDGNLNIDPFSTKLANQPVRLGGSYNLGGTLDFRVDATVEKDILSNEIQNMIAYIPGHQRVSNIDVGVNIKGDAKNPNVTVDQDKIKKQVMDQLKNSSSKEIEDAAKKLLKELFK